MTLRTDGALDGPADGSPVLPDLSAVLAGTDCGSSRAFARLRFWTMLAVCAGAGALYGAISPTGRPGNGLVYGFCLGGAVMLYEQGVIAPRLRERLRRLPLVAGVIGTEIAYIVMISIGTVVAGSLLKLTGVTAAEWRDAVVPTPIVLLYSLLVSGMVISVDRMRALIGAEVFRNLLLGRYHVPVEEERIFLFIDLIGSTSYAQRHGDVRAQAFLGAIFAALAEPVRRCRGSIDDYVGDMALVTWPLAVGTTDARCVLCVFAFLEAVAREADRWAREFGQVPQFRAALHGGRVVTAEVGIDRHKIAYFGDVVNTTGRLEGLCRTLDTPVLISSELLDRIPALPRGLRATDLGAHAVKGRGETLSVFGLDTAVRPRQTRHSSVPGRAPEGVPDTAGA